MKILFVGSFVSNELEQKSKYISSAGNRFQNNVIEHLEKVGYQVMRMSYLGVPLEEEERRELPVYCIAKNGNLLQSVIRFQKWLKHEIQETDIVICYNIIYAWLNLPCLAKRFGKKSIVILADYSDETCFSSLKAKLYAKCQRMTLRRFEKVVGLSKNIEKICKTNQTFVLMEGGIDESFFDAVDSDVCRDSSLPFTFMYSGLISKVTGVDLLIEAFMKQTDTNIRLVLTGKGPLDEYVLEKSTVDKRIDFRGTLPYEKYITLLKQADVLVNPRNMHLPENQNNFPSKIMDYLATGKTVVSTKFAGYEKYSDRFLFSDSDSDSLGKALRAAMEQSNFGKENREYAKEFLWTKQVERMIKD